MNTKKIIIFIFSIFLISSNTKNIDAQFFDSNFNPNYIISDFELEDYNSMSLDDIKYFLSQNDGVLKYYKEKNPITGKLMTASEIIYESSRAYKINPQYLITLLQKEQSLITDPNPSQKQLDWATGFAICDSCSMNDPILLKFKGFYNQVFYAAQRNRFYIDSRDQKWLFQINKNYNIDNVLVSPLNQATVNLYNYTPHINGNYNFWKIWQKWFTKKYPNGSILKEANSKTVWLIEDGYRRPFVTWTAFISRYKPQDILNANHSDLTKYPIGTYIQFQNYSYLKTPDKKIYLLDNDKLREFESSEVVRYFGVNPEEIINITWEDFRYYTEGEKITIKSTYPNGAILENKDNKKIYYVKNGIKYPILDLAILKTNYSNQIKTTVNGEELDAMEIGNPIKFKDGVLIKQKNVPIVYIVSDEKLHPIKNEKVFEALGYKWEDVVGAEDYTINQYAIGEIIDVNPEKINPDELLPNENNAKPL